MQIDVENESCVSCLKQQKKLHHDKFELICFTWYCTSWNMTIAHAYIVMPQAWFAEMYNVDIFS